jgi:cation:H+ antiporter
VIRDNSTALFYSERVITPGLVVLHASLLVLGMAMLYFGGSALVGGASGIALNLDLSPLVVGLTVVAFGTSAPELFVSVLSAVQGRMGISIGNVIGSNVINIALVLGIAGIARPTIVDRSVIRVDAPFIFVTYAALGLAALNVTGDLVWIGGVIQRWEGLLLVLTLVVYVLILYLRSQWGRPAPVVVDEIAEEEVRARSIWLDVLLVALGVGLLAAGAESLVRGASWLAVNLFGAGERFVGIAIVALGTSLPELFTTIVSISRGEMDISVGNIVGSNIFNSLMVLGVTSLILPIEIGDTDFSGDFVFMVATTLILVVSLTRRRKVTRATGVLLILVYCIYVAFLTATRTA